MTARVASLALFLWAGTFGAALAQSLPTVPPEVKDNPFVQSLMQAAAGLFQSSNGNTAHGRVTYFHRFDLQLETAPNVYRTIHLHQGTEIDPRGTTLAPGMVVDVRGVAQPDHSLNADAIVAH